MSKKMMKRSLALGALMAFVITGSAMAAEELTGGALKETLKGGEYKVTAGDVTLSQGDNYKHIAGASGGNSILVENAKISVDEGKTLTINSSEPGTDTWGAIKNTTITGNGTVKITSTNKAAALGYYSKDSITAKNIELKGTKYGVYSSDGTEHTLVADYINIESAGRTVFAGTESKVEITANEKLTVTSTEKKVAMTTNGDGNINVTAKDIQLNGGIEALNTSKVTLNASNNITIDGVVQGADGKKSQVGLKGNNVTITANAIESSETEGAVRNVNIEASGKVTINASGDGLCGVGAGKNDATRAQALNSIKAKEIEITSEGAFGVYANNHGYHTVGTRVHSYLEAETINITSKKDGIYASNGAVTEVKGFKTLNVTSTGEQGIGSEYGHLTFVGGDVVVTSEEEGIRSKLGGELNFEVDSLKVTAGLESIKLTGNSVLNIDANTVQLDGDITTEAADGKNPVLTVAFNDDKSYFNGKVTTVDGAQTNLTFANGATWNLGEKTESTVSNATFKAGSNLVIDGNAFEESTGKYVLNASSKTATLNVEQGAKLAIEGIEENVTYNVANGFSITKEEGANWVINNLMTGEWSDTNGLQVTTKAKDAGQIADDMGVGSGTASALGSIIEAANKAGNVEGTPAANVVALANAIANAPAEQAADAANAVVKMAEAGGNSATAASIVKNVTGVTNDRLSFNCGHGAPHKGGHGVGLFEEGSGADIWVEYVHGKDKVEDMKSTAGATSYEGQYNGIVMGVDFKKVNKFQSGVAFNYGEGDTNSVGTSSRTHSDYDFWGIGYYGNIHNDDSNIIFDINYAKSDSDVTNNNLVATYEASPETTTWTAGVKVEKLYQNDNVQIVPYTGLRYMSIDSDDYATKCGTYKYSMDRQDIWLLPLGVSIKQEVTNDNGWTVSPRIDLSYIWAFGDTDSNMEFATALNTKTNIGYDVMDDGSFLGLVGIEAHKGQWGYGVSYSYQKGDHSESKKWFVDVNYSF